MLKPSELHNAKRKHNQKYLGYEEVPGHVCMKEPFQPSTHDTNTNVRFVMCLMLDVVPSLLSLCSVLLLCSHSLLYHGKPGACHNRQWTCSRFYSDGLSNDSKCTWTDFKNSQKMLSPVLFGKERDPPLKLPRCWIITNYTKLDWLCRGRAASSPQRENSDQKKKKEWRVFFRKQSLPCRVFVQRVWVMHSWKNEQSGTSGRDTSQVPHTSIL